MATTTSQNPRAYGPAINPAAYKAALRHSRRVKSLKILMPVLALVVSGLFISVSFVRAFLPDNVTIEHAKIEDGKIVMEKPSLAGHNADGTPYALSAARALQDIASPNLLTLETINAIMPGENGLTAKVRAALGLFDRDTDKLQLTAPFDIDLSNGINAHFRSADIDMRAGTLTSDERISIVMSDASIVANSFVMEHKGETMTFKGAVKVLVNPSALRKKGE